MKEQSKISSLIETIVNIGSGFILAIGIQLILFPMMGIEVELSENITIASIFLLASVIRSYFWRRFFNWLHCKENK